MKAALVSVEQFPRRLRAPTAPNRFADLRCHAGISSPWSIHTRVCSGLAWMQFFCNDVPDAVSSPQDCQEWLENVPNEQT